MSEKIIKANIIFFDSNPIGRIITRFSKDIVLLDSNLPLQLLWLLLGGLRFISVAITVVIVIPWLIIPIFVVCILLVVIVMIGAAAMS